MLIVETFVLNTTETNGLSLKGYSISMACNKRFKMVLLQTV